MVQRASLYACLRDSREQNGTYKVTSHKSFFVGITLHKRHRLFFYTYQPALRNQSKQHNN